MTLNDASTMPRAVAAWHDIVADPIAGHVKLPALLADTVVFRSPAVHQPQEGVEKTLAYLRAALVVLGPSLQYRREWHDERSAVLEFEATLDGLSVQGIDLIVWDEEDRITEFTVMARPLKGLHRLVESMGEQLRAAS